MREKYLGKKSLRLKTYSFCKKADSLEESIKLTHTGRTELDTPNTVLYLPTQNF